jgi:hypothetical protein
MELCFRLLKSSHGLTFVYFPFQSGDKKMFILHDDHNEEEKKDEEKPEVIELLHSLGKSGNSDFD